MFFQDEHEINDYISQLYEKYYKVLYHIIRNHIISKNKDDIDSCIQETFIVVLKKKDQLKNIRYELGWLTKIAIYVTMNYNAKIRNYYRKFSIIEDMEYITDDKDFEEEVNNRILYQEYKENHIVQKIMGDLTKEQRQLLYLKFVLHKKNEEIGRILGISQLAVNGRVYRLKGKIKKYIYEHL